jgi:hypothetical protein
MIYFWHNKCKTVSGYYKEGGIMNSGNFNNWLKAFEQEIIEVASRIEAIRKKMLTFSTRESNELGSLKALSNSLQREAMNLRQLSQRVNFKNTQISRTEGITEKLIEK